MQRLDKFLSAAGVGSRKEIKALVRSGAVQVNAAVVREPERKIDPQKEQITVRGKSIEPERIMVVLLHKPAGVVTATSDSREETVMPLLPPWALRQGVKPVGRLDKETEGLLLFTNDGALAHRLISPQYAVKKVYYVQHEGAAGPEDVAAFAQGITLRDGDICRPAELIPLGPGESRVVVTEGKYHQVRRMMASRGLPVNYLRREQEGSLCLGSLPVGQCRELTEEEIAALMSD